MCLYISLSLAKSFSLSACVCLRIVVYVCLHVCLSVYIRLLICLLSCCPFLFYCLFPTHCLRLFRIPLHVSLPQSLPVFPYCSHSIHIFLPTLKRTSCLEPITGVGGRLWRAGRPEAECHSPVVPYQSVLNISYYGPLLFTCDTRLGLRNCLREISQPSGTKVIAVEAQNPIHN